MRSVMRACIGSNRAPDGRYAEIDLPASPYRLLNALDEIGIKSTKEIVYQEILNYGSFGYLEPHFDEYTMLEELNALAQKLAVFDRVDSIAFEGLAKEVEAKSSIKVLANISRMSALRMSVPSRTSKMRMQQVTAFADIAALSPSSTVRRAMCCRDTARAMPPLCFSKIGLLAFQHQSATGGSSPLAKAMRSCFIIKTPSATRRQALCLDITFSGLARTRFPATLSTSATMTSTVICTPSILFSQRKIALRQ